MMNENDEMNEQLADENRRLREELFCAKRGVPEEYREDMALLARNRAEKNGSDFESAAEEILERYSRLMTRRSGTQLSRTANDDTALRKAFGLMKGE